MQRETEQDATRRYQETVGITIRSQGSAGRMLEWQ